MIAQFDEETPVQQWYNDASFSGFDFDYGGMAGASSSHPLLLTPLLRQIHEMLKKEKVKMMTISEVSRRPPQHFLGV
jgi:hypothetical protein